MTETKDKEEEKRKNHTGGHVFRCGSIQFSSLMHLINTLHTETLKSWRFVKQNPNLLLYIGLF